jgi:hypothetical protein
MNFDVTGREEGCREKSEVSLILKTVVARYLFAGREWCVVLRNGGQK